MEPTMPTTAKPAHTAGLIERRTNVLAAGPVCIAIGNTSVAGHVRRSREQRDADLDRLADCWNALASIPDPAAAIRQAREALAALAPADPHTGQDLSGGPTCLACGIDRFNGHAEDCAWLKGRAALSALGEG